MPQHFLKSDENSSDLDSSSRELKQPDPMSGFLVAQAVLARI
jgi:hypothetical protein